MYVGEQRHRICIVMSDRKSRLASELRLDDHAFLQKINRSPHRHRASVNEATGAGTVPSWRATSPICIRVV